MELLGIVGGGKGSNAGNVDWTMIVRSCLSYPSPCHLRPRPVPPIAGSKFKPSFNQSFRMDDSPTGWWVSLYHFGIDQGPVVLMIENYCTGLIWNITRRCLPVRASVERVLPEAGCKISLQSCHFPLTSRSVVAFLGPPLSVIVT